MKTRDAISFISSLNLDNISRVKSTNQNHQAGKRRHVALLVWPVSFESNLWNAYNIWPKTLPFSLFFSSL